MLVIVVNVHNGRTGSEKIVGTLVEIIPPLIPNQLFEGQEVTIAGRDGGPNIQMQYHLKCGMKSQLAELVIHRHVFHSFSANI